GLGHEPPVQLAAKSFHPEVGVHDQLELVAASRFEQKDLHLRIGRQASGDDRTGRSRSANDEVEPPAELAGDRLSIRLDLCLDRRLTTTDVFTRLMHRLFTTPSLVDRVQTGSLSGVGVAMRREATLSGSAHASIECAETAVTDGRSLGHSAREG